MSSHCLPKMLGSSLRTCKPSVLLVVCWLYYLSRCMASAGQLVAVGPDSLTDQLSAVQLSNGQFPQPVSSRKSWRTVLLPVDYSQLNPVPQQSSDLRVFPFVVDPLIIIALIALPTIGLLGLSSLIMPLIPIGLYLIQLFFPAGGSGRKRRQVKDSDTMEGNKTINSEFDIFIAHLSQAFDKYTELNESSA